MKKSLQRIIFLSIFLLLVFAIIVVAQSWEVFSLKDDMFVTYSDIENINKEKTFGSFVSAGIDDKVVQVGNEKMTISKLIFKLFGFIPIREINVEVSDGKSLYLGGTPIGFAIDIDGLLIMGSTAIESSNGNVDVMEEAGLKVGDIITEINGSKVSDLKDVANIIDDKKYKGESLKITAIRKNQKFSTELKPALDVQSGKYKIGLWVKNDASGVGTITYIDEQTNKFGALGHPITDFDTGVVVPAKSGKVFNCSVVGLSKGQKGTPGEMKGVFMQGKNSKGEILKNTNCGVFGEITDKSNVVDLNKRAGVGGRLSVKPGKATLVSSITGVSENYEIEIIKANYQPKTSDKSFVFRVTDERLLDLTGGIIQGMSGSPIMQNGKIIGAVTHVFVTDPTKGYGIYIDWMLEESESA